MQSSSCNGLCTTLGQKNEACDGPRRAVDGSLSAWRAGWGLLTFSGAGCSRWTRALGRSIEWSSVCQRCGVVQTRSRHRRCDPPGESNSTLIRRAHVLRRSLRLALRTNHRDFSSVCSNWRPISRLPCLPTSSCSGYQSTPAPPMHQGTRQRSLAPLRFFRPRFRANPPKASRSMPEVSSVVISPVCSLSFPFTFIFAPPTTLSSLANATRTLDLAQTRQSHAPRAASTLAFPARPELVLSLLSPRHTLTRWQRPTRVTGGTTACVSATSTPLGTIADAHAALQYNPSYVLPIVSIVLFGIAFLAHLVIMIRTKSYYVSCLRWPRVSLGRSRTRARPEVVGHDAAGGKKTLLQRQRNAGRATATAGKGWRRGRHCSFPAGRDRAGSRGLRRSRFSRSAWAAAGVLASPSRREREALRRTRAVAAPSPPDRRPRPAR